LAKGFTADQFEQAIDEYSLLDVSSILEAHEKRFKLTNSNRSGKQPEKVHDLSLSKLAWKTRIWMQTTTSRRRTRKGGSGSMSFWVRRTEALDIRMMPGYVGTTFEYADSLFNEATIHHCCILSFDDCRVRPRCCHMPRHDICRHASSLNPRGVATGNRELQSHNILTPVYPHPASC
jgi:hypothetical protein